MSDRGAATRYLVVQTSTELFAECGYDATTLRMLAERAGLPLSTFYYYFSRKHDVLLAIMDDVMSRLERAAGDVVATRTNAVQRVAALVDAHVRVHLTAPEAARVTDAELSALDLDARKQMVARRDRYESALRQALADGVDESVFPADLDVPLASMSILTMSTGVIDWWHPDGRLRPDEVAERISAFALAIATAGSPSSLDGRAVGDRQGAQTS